MAGFAKQVFYNISCTVLHSTGWFHTGFTSCRQLLHLVQPMAMANNNDVFCMLATEDKLDGTNYPLWAYMMHHVLVAKGLWNIVKGVDVRPIVGRDVANATEIGDVEDVAVSSTAAPTIRAPPPTAEQIHWDGRDAQAHALLALSIKRVVSHIFALAGHLKMLGMYLPHCSRQGMRLVLLISENSWRVSI